MDNSEDVFLTEDFLAEALASTYPEPNPGPYEWAGYYCNFCQGEVLLNKDTGVRACSNCGLEHSESGFPTEPAPLKISPRGIKRVEEASARGETCWAPCPVCGELSEYEGSACWCCCCEQWRHL
jgi:hypothetical protein